MFLNVFGVEVASGRRNSSRINNSKVKIGEGRRQAQQKGKGKTNKKEEGEAKEVNIIYSGRNGAV